MDYLKTDFIKISEIISIARRAGEKILEIYYDLDNFDVETKADNSPLTRADKEANTIICEGLNALDYQYPILSEENKMIPFEKRKNYEFMWVVDPLDGTKEFIKRNDEFTVNIALVESGVPVAGVVYAPVKDEMYFAVKSKGAFSIIKGQQHRIFAQAFKENQSGLSIVCSRSHLNSDTQDFINKYQDPVKVAKGSSLKFLVLASGEAHLYPRLAPTMEWDTAAAQIILEESGGSVVDADTGIPLRYNKINLLNPHFIASANSIQADK